MALSLQGALRAVLIGAIVLAQIAATPHPAPPSAEDFYARAVEQMRHHPDPAFATYDAPIGGLNCIPTAGGIAFTLGRSTAESEKPFHTGA